MIFASTAFYGVFVVMPGTFILFGLTLAWLGSCTRRISERNGPKSWSLRRFLLFVYLPLIARAYVPFTAISLAWRATNDAAEGDSPLDPFIYTLPYILLYSALVALPYAQKVLSKSREARRLAEFEDLKEIDASEPPLTHS